MVSCENVNCILTALLKAGVAAAALEEGAAAATPPPVPAETTFPWSSISATAAKFVLIPKTALKASACAPVLAVSVSAAAFALVQVSLAV